MVVLANEYAKNTGIGPEDVKKFRAWVSKQPHLPGEHIPDLDLILALNSKNSMEMAKQALDMNLTAKTFFADLFKDRALDQRLLDALDTILFLPLKERTPEGYAVLYGHLLDYNPDNLNFVDVIRALFAVLDVWQHVEGTWPGLVFAFDLNQVVMGHLAVFARAPTMQQFLYYIQDGLLVKLKGFHFLNAPAFVDKLMMIMKPFIKNTLMENFHIHQVGSSTLDAYIPRKALPKESGGEYLTLKEGAAEVKRMVKSGEQFLAQENKKRVTESKRPGGPKTISDIFVGMEGSFKKLEMD